MKLTCNRSVKKWKLRALFKNHIRTSHEKPGTVQEGDRKYRQPLPQGQQLQREQRSHDEQAIKHDEESQRDMQNGQRADENSERLEQEHSRTEAMLPDQDPVHAPALSPDQYNLLEGD